MICNIPTKWTETQIKTLCLSQITSTENPEIKKMRLLKDPTKIDVETNGWKSRGICFVEFETHEMALDCLRNLNNNPTVFSQTARPIVEFAVEDVRALHVLKLREERKKASDLSQGNYGPRGNNHGFKDHESQGSNQSEAQKQRVESLVKKSSYWKDEFYGSKRRENKDNSKKKIKIIAPKKKKSASNGEGFHKKRKIA